MSKKLHTVSSLLSSYFMFLPPTETVKYIQHNLSKHIKTIQNNIYLEKNRGVARKNRPLLHETLRSREQFGEFRILKELCFHRDQFQVYYQLS